MAQPIADASDITGRIDTNLDAEEIDTFLSDAAFDLSHAYPDLESKGTEWRKQLEWRLAAYKIMTLPETDTIQETRESVTLHFSESRIDNLRQEIRGMTNGKLPIDDDQTYGSYEVF